ncbi:RND transporter [Siphonobacter sp. BAB-5385]|uniref:TolC family protein n=1 Tax=Siphonobacter sp. BAB-5385 TaxID=1864822 RepID=UPI000B9EDB66|nr:TolC family protein [Siphonobacter sp. BAB-5385]OZI09673.1 RND transporter [Siphonobacter sp. BAB-5385]
MNRKRQIFSILAGAWLLSLSSCRVRHTPATLAPVPVPSAYAGSLNDPNTDSLSIGNDPYNRLFTDANLVALIDTALARNLDVKMALQRLEVTRAQYGISQAALRPQVDAVVSAGVDRFGRYTLNGVGNYDTNFSEYVTGSSIIPNPVPDYFVGFRSSWEIDLWGKLRNRKRAAYNRVLASQEGRNVIVTDLVAEVARLYFTLLSLDAELEIIRDNVELQQQALSLVEVQKAAGRVTELAVQQFNAQLLNTKSLEGGVRQQILQAENQINVLLGRYPQPIQRGISIREQQLPATVAAGVPAQLMSRRPDIRQVERELEAANIDVAVARAEFLPSLNLTPYVGLNAFRLGVLGSVESMTAGILGGLSAPVLNRRFIKGNLRVTEAERNRSFLAYQQVILRGVSEVVQSLKGLENFRNVADYQTQQVNVLKQAATTSDNLFATGYATYLEVITAQRSVLESELSLINTKRSQFLSLVDLYRALGGGWQ